MCQLRVLRKLAPILQSVHTDRCVRPYSHFYCSSSVCVSAPAPLFLKFPDTCGGKHNLLWLFSLQRIHTTDELQTLGMASKLKSKATNLLNSRHFCSLSFLDCSSVFLVCWFTCYWPWTKDMARQFLTMTSNIGVLVCNRVGIFDIWCHDTKKNTDKVVILFHHA